MRTALILLALVVAAIAGGLAGRLYQAARLRERRPIAYPCAYLGRCTDRIHRSCREAAMPW